MGLWAPADILLKKLNALWLLKIIIINPLIKKKRERRDNRSLLDIHATSTRTVLSVISPWSSNMCRERTLSCVSNEPNTSSTIVAAYESTVFGYNPDTIFSLKVKPKVSVMRVRTSTGLCTVNLPPKAFKVLKTQSSIITQFIHPSVFHRTLTTKAVTYPYSVSTCDSLTL